MEKKKDLTNEYLAKKFENNFKLVGHAISVATDMIKSGRDSKIRHSEYQQNKAMLVFEEIKIAEDVI